MLGLKRGTVILEAHRTEWERQAGETIRLLKRVLGEAAVDAQHVGSTAVPGLPAKPILDLAVGVRDYDAVLALRRRLEENGVVFRFDERPTQLLFVMGDFTADTRTHHIHVVRYGSEEWENYLRFRDYLRENADAAARYAAEKRRLAERFPNDRNAYTEAKSAIVRALLEEAKRK